MTLRDLTFLVGTFVGVVLVVVVGLLAQPQRYCRECGAPLPKIRRWDDLKILWGEGTCPGCGCLIDCRGRKIEK